MHLTSMTWKKAKEKLSDKIIGVIPLGSVEQHGPIGPLGTDYLIPENLAGRVERLYPEDIVVLPVMPYGVCPYHSSFQGTIDIGMEALGEVMTKISSSLMATGIKKIIFINGHGGNGPAIDRAALEVFRNGGLAAIIDWWILAAQLNPEWAGGHGAGQENSVMMYLRPEWVDTKDIVPTKVNHLSESLSNININSVSYKGGIVRVIRDVESVSSSGAFEGADPTEKADSTWGKEIAEGVTEYIKEFIKEFLNVNIESCHKKTPW